MVQSRLVQIGLVASAGAAEQSVQKVGWCAIVRSRSGAVLNLSELTLSPDAKCSDSKSEVEMVALPWCRFLCDLRPPFGPVLSFEFDSICCSNVSPPLVEHVCMLRLVDVCSESSVYVVDRAVSLAEGTMEPHTSLRRVLSEKVCWRDIDESLMSALFVSNCTSTR